MKRPPGRPPGILKPDARRIKVTVRFTDEEFKLVTELAELRVLTVAEVVREGTMLAVARGDVR